jgi:hypothetical protein
MQHLLFPKHTSQRRMEIRLFRKRYFMNPNLSFPECSTVPVMRGAHWWFRKALINLAI